MKLKENLKEFYDVSIDIGRLVFMGVVVFIIISVAVFVIDKLYVYAVAHKKGVIITAHQNFYILLSLVILYFIFAMCAYLISVIKKYFNGKNK